MINPGDSPFMGGSVGRITVAGVAVEGEVGGRGMAIQTARPVGPSIQVRTMAESTGFLDVGCRIVERAVGPGPILRMGEVEPVTALTADTAYPAVESRVVARSAGLTVTDLAGCHILFGVRTVLTTGKIAAVYRMMTADSN